MTILHAGLLESCQDCYLDHTLNPHLLNFKLQKLSLNYSETLLSLLNRMLSPHHLRPNLSELEVELGQVMESIEIEDTINLSRLPGCAEEGVARDGPDLAS
jgi:hypothetical protein